METGQSTATMNAPLVLNVSTRGNIQNHNIANGQPPIVLGKRGANKLPSTITVKTISKAGGVKKEKADAMVDIIQLGDPDAENRPPKGTAPQQQQPQTVMVSKAMTFDQQSQTDTKMYDHALLPPATAAQMQQQSQQIAQLIRANNGLVIEVRQLKESNQTMREMVVELDRKMIRLLTVVGCPEQVRMNADKNLTEDEKQQHHLNFVDVNVDYENPVTEIIEYGGGAGDASNDQYSILYDGASTSVQSQQSESVPTRPVKSENTPPLKKNKLKMQQAAEAETPKYILGDDEYEVIGVNKTRVPKHILHELCFGNYSSVTRKILASVFDRETLATHSLTGKPSPGK